MKFPLCLGIGLGACFSRLGRRETAGLTQSDTKLEEAVRKAPP
jgi:hypothetical protein